MKDIVALWEKERAPAGPAPRRRPPRSTPAQIEAALERARAAAQAAEERRAQRGSGPRRVYG